MWVLLKFAALLSVTACFLLRMAKKATGSAIGLITGPQPEVVPIHEKSSPARPSPPTPPQVPVEEKGATIEEVGEC